MLKATVLTASMMLVWTSVAQAHQTHLRGKPPTAIKKLHRWQVRNLTYMNYVCTHGKGKPRRWACHTRKWLAKEARQTRPTPSRPPHFYQWLCIFSHENAGYGWTANTGNGYYGGLQFAESTWTRNGGLKYASYANYATPLQQMWTAENAWKESGNTFSQWPNTSRMCGLR